MNMEHQSKSTPHQSPVAAGKSRHRRPSVTLVTWALFTAVLCSILLTGCCKIIPFSKCRPNKVLSIYYRTDSDSNNGNSVQLRFILLENQAAFGKCPARVVFKPEEDQASYGGLAVLEGYAPFDVFLSPGDTGSVVWTIDEYKGVGEVPLYLGIIANFAQPASGRSGRAVVPLERRRIPRAIGVRVGRDYLQITTAK